MYNFLCRAVHGANAGGSLFLHTNNITLGLASPFESFYC
ncbi:protein of unknown function [Agreia sp. COWG]|nr:protein of unknown function [Agreia sp. COWG]